MWCCFQMCMLYTGRFPSSWPRSPSWYHKTFPAAAMATLSPELCCEWNSCGHSSMPNIVEPNACDMSDTVDLSAWLIIRQVLGAKWPLSFEEHSHWIFFLFKFSFVFYHQECLSMTDCYIWWKWLPFPFFQQHFCLLLLLMNPLRCMHSFYWRSLCYDD